jgi:fructose-specific phosphotransferase system IIC component
MIAAFTVSAVGDALFSWFYLAIGLVIVAALYSRSAKPRAWATAGFLTAIVLGLLAGEVLKNWPDIKQGFVDGYRLFRP